MRKTKKYLARVVLLIYAFFSVGPILWVLMNSFKSTADITAYPPKFVNFVPTLNNYVGIFSSSSFLEPFQNSLIVTGGAVLLGMITGLPVSMFWQDAEFLFARTLPSPLCLSGLLQSYLLCSRCWRSIRPCSYKILILDLFWLIS